METPGLIRISIFNPQIFEIQIFNFPIVNFQFFNSQLSIFDFRFSIFCFHFDPHINSSFFNFPVYVCVFVWENDTVYVGEQQQQQQQQRTPAVAVAALHPSTILFTPPHALPTFCTLRPVMKTLYLPDSGLIWLRAKPWGKRSWCLRCSAP